MIVLTCSVMKRPETIFSDTTSYVQRSRSGYSTYSWAQFCNPVDHFFKPLVCSLQGKENLWYCLFSRSHTAEQTHVFLSESTLTRTRRLRMRRRDE